MPIRCPNFRELAVKAGETQNDTPHPITPAFAGDIGAEREPRALLAMQKVEGSNPFSRFSKGRRLQVFFVGAVGLCVCIARTET